MNLKSYPKVAVGALIRDSRERILLIRRGHEPNRGKWAVPGGKVEMFESIQDAVKREVMEETGLQVEVRRLLAIVELMEGGFHYVILDFEAEMTGGSPRPSTDADELRFFTLEEALKLDLTYTMRDMLERLNKGDPLPLWVTQISR